MPLTVVVVDDHAGFRSWARRLLEEDGLQVLGEAADGEGALRAVLRLQPELVLLDVQLPDMSGLEVARRLAALATPPVVVLTSTQDASDYGQGIERSAARGFIPKADLSGAALVGLFGEHRSSAG